MSTIKKKNKNTISNSFGRKKKKVPAIRLLLVIHIVGTPVDGKEYIIGSCKYRNEPIGVDEFELLKHYAEVFGKGEKYHYYIFSKSGFTKRLQSLGDKGEVKLVTLRDIYE